MIRIASSLESRRSAYEYSVPEVSGPMWRSDYFVPQSESDIQAFLIELRQPASVIRPHFHFLEQFQVFVSGSGRLGNRELEPITVFYTDGYSPYGPITAGPDGLAFFTLRPRRDPGAQYMPESRTRLTRRAGRNLLGFRAPNADELANGTGGLKSAIEPQTDGVAAYWLTLTPGEDMHCPEPRLGGGQYYLVCSGEPRLNGVELPTWSGLHVSSDEAPPRFSAVGSTADVLVVQFAATSALA